jgi:hypothetical protein
MTVETNQTQSEEAVKINPNEIKVRDYVTMQEILAGKGGAHKDRKKEKNRKKCRGRVRGEE